jgi:phosphotransferase system enzyme I (PtsP)
LSDGLAHGDAVIHDPPVEVHALIADDPERETQRLEQALLDLSAAIDGMLAGLAARGGVEDRAILETYRMFAQDRGWRERIGEAIRGGLTADAAVQRVQLETRARMAQMREPFFRERLHDFEDLSNRLLRHLAGRGGFDPKNLPENAVLVARSLGPAELLDYDAANLKAVLLEEGSQTEHSVVVARSLGVPMIGRLGESIKKVRAGDPVIVDGRHGVAFLRPAEDVFAQYDENLAARNERRAEYVAQRSEPAITRDGVRIRLDMNAGLLLDMPHLEDSGAEGIGLFRTELQFMVQPEFPDVRTQIEIYSRILDEAGDKPVLFRTLDIGGDKILPYHDGPLEREENPAMGWRAIRVGLDRPALLRTQLRALLYAASGRHLGVMFPMVAEVPELRAARRILDLEIERLARRNVAPPARLEVGIMLEVPALFWQLENLLPLVDFVSIGSNDLIQFLFAADRSSPRLSERYDVMAPGFLRLLRTLVEACGEAGVQVSLCGEMAGRPLDAMALVGVGLRALSVAPSAVGAVKRMIRSVDCGQLTAYMNRLYDAGDHSIRDNLKNFAQDHHFLV